jgi:hypothetical protein
MGCYWQALHGGGQLKIQIFDFLLLIQKPPALRTANGIT